MTLFIIVSAVTNLLLLAAAIALLRIIKSQSERMARLDEQSRKLVEAMEHHAAEDSETDSDGG